MPYPYLSMGCFCPGDDGLVGLQHRLIKLLVTVKYNILRPDSSFYIPALRPGQSFISEIDQYEQPILDVNKNVPRLLMFRKAISFASHGRVFFSKNNECFILLIEILIRAGPVNGILIE